ncbi:hypothetical protein GCM10010121_012470 [Streptomyces brasiliensis]|uniref:Uncharacterized protein n=1 Tax=Streptomyces brasiliensis TaxID=1954 RepID=A0A917K9G8_9ACTN|nr:hypothetical protein GCM10010121_012470 [Streptomyces brasiliensis]
MVGFVVQDRGITRLPADKFLARDEYPPGRSHHAHVARITDQHAKVGSPIYLLWSV